ncbi:hypothetical protein RN001_012236 [Aquatica leii]|uniref:polynucleotide adenylyltransferase n=1 Tax=Aquatica leii TaxID=1421715 RepID=A0AAN7P2R0_9COLE|nr:hypothetical protein RN001_012236 [Aquatica leii]
MGTEFKDIDMNMEDSGNSCGSSVVSDFSGNSGHTDFFDGDGDDMQVFDLEGDNDKDSLHILKYEQVRRLNDVMDEVVSIHGSGNFSTLEIKLRDLVNVVCGKLEADTASGGAGMQVRDIRLNVGAASHVFATESQPYNDLDLIFGVELSSGRNYDCVKSVVLNSLFDLLPDGVIRKRISTFIRKFARS